MKYLLSKNFGYTVALIITTHLRPGTLMTKASHEVWVCCENLQFAHSADSRLHRGRHVGYALALQKKADGEDHAIGQTQEPCHQESPSISEQLAESQHKSWSQISLEVHHTYGMLSTPPALCKQTYKPLVDVCCFGKQGTRSDYAVRRVWLHKWHKRNGGKVAC